MRHSVQIYGNLTEILGFEIPFTISFKTLANNKAEIIYNETTYVLAVDSLKSGYVIKKKSDYENNIQSGYFVKLDLSEEVIPKDHHLKKVSEMFFAKVFESINIE